MGFDKSRKIIRNLIILSILLVLFTGYLLITHNSRFKIKMGIQTMFNKAEDILTNIEKTELAKFVLENNVEYTNRVVTNVSLYKKALEKYLNITTEDFQNLINGSTITTNIKSDIPNKYINMDFEYSLADERILTSVYLDNNNMYIYMKDYMNTILKIDSENMDEGLEFKQVNINEIKHIMNIIKNSAVNASEFSDVTNTKTEITVDNTNIKVNKTTLTIDTEYIKRFTIILSNKLMRDEKAMNILYATGKYKSRAELENKIKDQIIKSERENMNYQRVGEYSIYTSGIFNKLIKNEYVSFDDKNTSAELTTFKASKFDTQLSVYENKELVSNLNILKKEKDVYNIKYTKGKDISLDIMGKISGNLVDISYALRLSKRDELKGDIKFENYKKNTNEFDQKFVLRLNTPESYGTAQISIDSNVKKIGRIEKPDFTNATNITSLKDSQKEEISRKIENRNPRTVNLWNNIIEEITLEGIIKVK